MSKDRIDLNGKTILVTGSPGFIGANLVLRLLKEMSSGTVISLDNMNDYYDPKLKEYRLSLIEEASKSSNVKHVFIKGSIADSELIERIFDDYEPSIVVNLAAQAGVRYSIDHPDVYIESNIIGFYNILECCRRHPVKHLVYASSSSVYGGNKKVPFSTDDKVDNPVSLYAATKKSNELLAHAYSKLYNIPSTGLRFFTVYGPAGRPDMFYFSATNKLVKGEASKSSNVKHVFIKGSIADSELIERIFDDYEPSIVVNLAAQAGVRYSIDHPDVYIESNIIGFYNILEACRNNPVEHLVYASSSSVYGGNKKVPFSVDDKVDNPVSLYAATKKSNELLAHAYSKLYNIPSTGLRFFTVYGPAGRPDMFYFSATNTLAKDGTIKIFNYGNCKRDFTYVDDIVEGVYRVMQGAPEKQNGEDGLPLPPYAVYNIGGGTPENLLDYISTLQEELVNAGVLPADYDFEGHRELVGMQPGDVPVTYADSKALEDDYSFRPTISIREGLRKFAQWYAEYYK